MTLDGFQHVAQLHTGKQISVSRAIRARDGLAVVLKALLPEAQTHSSVARMQYEYRVLSSLQTAQVTCVPTPLQLLETAGTMAFAMSDSGGKALRQVQAERSLDLSQVIQLGTQVAQALGELHRAQVIHRDINPANVVVGPQGTVEIIDFDLASLLARETQAGNVAQALEGTPLYMSPEQTGRMNRGVDHRSDLYSLGAMLYELLAGRVPLVVESGDPSDLLYAIVAQAPPPLLELAPRTPPMLAQVVHKLLAKVPDERYVSAQGLVHDLRACAEGVARGTPTHMFVLGAQDRDERFDIPQKLYGRATETQALFAAYERVARGTLEFVWVGGGSGMGKSALAHELQRKLLEHKGLFAGGKHDQLRRNQPFSALAQAITEVVRRILIEPDAVVEAWQRSVRESLGRVGAALVEIVPALTLLVGPQPPVPALGPAETEARLLNLLHRFLLGLSKRQPLVLFLDDVQWADGATLKLLKHLASTPYQGAGILLLAAMRSQEMAADHPLRAVMDEMDGTGDTPSHFLEVTPLQLPAVQALVQDTTHAPPTAAAELAQLLQNKTGGNAFFVHEVLRAFYAEGLLTYDAPAGAWTWDLAAIERTAVSTYVADLLSQRLRGMPTTVQALLSAAACVGTEAHLDLLCTVLGAARAQLVPALQRALAEGVLLPLGNDYRYTDDSSADIGYRFAHDRLQKAAYDLLDKGEVQATHHRIARALLDAKSDSDPLRLAYHAAAAEPQVQDPAERLRYAQGCLAAGQQAASAMAYPTAQAYLQSCVQYLPVDAWGRQRELMRPAQLLLAEVEHLQGNAAAAERRLNDALSHAATPLEAADVHVARMMLLTFHARQVEGIDASVAALHAMGFMITRQPTLAHVGLALVRLRWQLRNTSIAALASAPEVTDPRMRKIVHTLLQIIKPGSAVQPLMVALVSLHACRLIALHGTVPDSDPYIAMMLISVNLLDYPAALQWRDAAHRIQSRFPENPVADATAAFAEAAYTAHLDTPSYALLQQAMASREQALMAGDAVIADHGLLLAHLIEVFCSLDTTQEHQQQHPEALQPQRINGYGLQALRQFIACLCGETTGLSAFSGPGFDEAVMRTVHSGSLLAVYYHLKMLAAWVHRDFPQALASLRDAMAVRLFETNVDATVAIFAFQATLVFTQSGASLNDRLFRQCLKRVHAVAANSKLYSGMPVLVQAERAGRRGRVAEALRLYDRSIDLLARSSYVCLHTAALECAARFCLGQGFHAAGVGYLARAYDGYKAWGARAKCGLLERELAGLHRRVAQDETVKNARSTKQATLKASEKGESWSAHEAAAMTQAALALSGEVQLEQLVQRILQSLQQATGATRAALLLPQGGELRVAGDTQPGAGLPDDVVRFVHRTQEPVLLNDAGNSGTFTGDYLRTAKPKAVLCVPLSQQGKAVGVTYLENSLATDTFGHRQLAVVKTLAAQAAISLRNADLYANLEREVATRTQELQEAHARMLRLEKQSTELRMAGGFAHEMGNALSSAEYPLQSVWHEHGGEDTLSAEMERTLGQMAALAPHLPGPQQAAWEGLAAGLRGQQASLQQVLAAVHSGLARGLSITAQVLAYAEVGEMVAPDAVAGVQNVLDGVLAQWTPRLQAQAIAVRTEVEAALQVGMRAEHAAQVLSGLLANAADALAAAAGAQRTVTVRASSYAGRVEISVEDSGVGIRDEARGRIFEPFYTTKGARGTGLTLGFCRKLVQVYGGDIAFDSTVGQGSVFRVVLPRR